MRWLLLTMALLAASDVVMIVGKRGSGKSTKAKGLIAQQLAEGGRVVAYDLHDEYSIDGEATPNVDLGPLTKRVTMSELLEHPELLDEPNLSLAVVPDNGRAATPEECADDIADLVALVRDTGNLLLVLDETGYYYEQSLRTLRQLATQSRHYGEKGVPLIFVAQRAVMVPRSARDEAGTLFVGLQTDPEDLAALRKLVRSNMTDEQADAFVQKVATLPKPGILEWREGGKAL